MISALAVSFFRAVGVIIAMGVMMFGAFHLTGSVDKLESLIEASGGTHDMRQNISHDQTGPEARTVRFRTVCVSPEIIHSLAEGMTAREAQMANACHRDARGLVATFVAVVETFEWPGPDGGPAVIIEVLGLKGNTGYTWYTQSAWDELYSHLGRPWGQPT